MQVQKVETRKEGRMPEPRLHEVTIGTLNGGAIPELFQRELSKVVENIDDPNTERRAKRKIVLEITFEPLDDTRESAAVAIVAKSKLAGVKPHGVSVWLSRSGGRLVAFQKDPRQYELPMVKESIEGGTDGSDS